MDRRAALGMALSAGALSVTGCGRSRTRGELTLWAMGVQGENGPRLMSAFEHATGLRVTVQSLPWTGAHAKMLTAYAGRSLPDVIMIPNLWVAELAMLGAIRPVPRSHFPETDQFAGATSAATIANRSMAVPWYVDTWVQYYRPDILAAAGYAEPPADWANWRAMALAIKRHTPDRFALLALLDWPEPLLALAAQQPDPLLRDEDTRGNFRSAGFREALRYYQALFDDGLAPAIVGREIGDSILAFKQGYFAILPSDATTPNDFRLANLADAMWRVSALPGPHGLADGLATGAALGVTRDAPDPAAAWSLARYLGSPAAQLALYETTGNLPSRPSVWAAAAIADSASASVLHRQIAHAPPSPRIPEWQRITTEMQSVAERMVRGQLTVDGAAQAIDARVDKLLEKRRWLRDRGRLT